MFNKAARDDVQVVESTTDFRKGRFPLIYLGCPIGHAKMKKVHFSDLIKNIHDKIAALER